MCGGGGGVARASATFSQLDCGYLLRLATPPGERHADEAGGKAREANSCGEVKLIASSRAAEKHQLVCKLNISSFDCGSDF